MQQLKRIHGRRLHAEAIYPRRSRYDSYAQRQGKNKLTTTAQKKVNLNNQRKNLAMLIDCNLPDGSVHWVLTYDDEHLPSNWTQATARAAALIRKVRELQRPFSGLVYFYNTEGKHYSEEHPDQSHRWHHHIYMPDYGITVGEMSAMWGRGHVYATELTMDGVVHTPVSRASYMIKEASEFPGKRAWHCSRSILRPEVETIMVPDDFALAAPDGAGVLEDSGRVETVYGKYRYIQYLTDIADG